MEASTTKPTRSTSRTSDTSDAKASEGELPEYEAALERGYLGYAVDQRPNEDYTVAGVVRRAEEGPPDVTAEAQAEPPK
jgi:hypothetical protein